MKNQYVEWEPLTLFPPYARILIQIAEKEIAYIED